MKLLYMGKISKKYIDFNLINKFYLYIISKPEN